MFRAAVRSSPRALRHSSVVASATGRRFASTAPADKRYTWKGTAARWGLAVGALYWYNTSPIFADEAPSYLSPEPPQFSESDLPTVDAIVEEKRKQIDARLKAREEKASKEASNAASAQPIQDNNQSVAVAGAPGEAGPSPEKLEEEAGNEGAFNPETGEINWDCPCLGGMANGPCGEEFKAAFSCFVYSTDEPKGMDCVDKFQHMQDCFRKYPEVYGEEIADEEAAEAEAAAVASGSPAPAPSSDGKDVSKDATKMTAAAVEAAPVQPEEKKSASKPVSKPEKQTPATHEFSSEEHKAGPMEAPTATKEKPVSNESQQALNESLGDKTELGIPRRSFDATSANASVSK